MSYKNDGNIKKDIKNFYETQSSEKTKKLEKWLNSGKPRIPQPLSYYYFEDRKIKTALKLSNLQKGSNILELGCNLGQMTFVLNQMGYSIVGADLSSNAIEKANLRVKHYNLSNISFEVQDVENITNHQDGEFDAVFAFSVLRYLPTLDKALKECYRMVRKGGCVVVDFPNKKCPWFGSIKSLFGIKPHIHDHLYDTEEVRNSMENAGFINIEIKHILFSYKELPSILLPFMIAGDFILEKIPLVNNYSGIIMAKGVVP